MKIILSFFVGNLTANFINAPLYIIFLVAAILLFLSIKNKQLLVFCAAVAGYLLVIGGNFITPINDFPKTEPPSVVMLQGEISSFVSNHDDIAFFDFKLQPQIKLAEGLTLNKLKVTWKKAPTTLQLGQKWQFEATVKPLATFKNPGLPDFSEKWRLQGFNAKAQVNAKTAKLLQQTDFWQQPLAATRIKINNNIKKLLPQSDAAAVIQALVIADKNRFSPQIWNMLQRSGTSHLVAISGLHISLITALAYLLSGLLLANSSRKLLWQTVISIIAATFYAALAGFQIATIRALIMVTVMLIANLYNHKISSISKLLLALVATLFINPTSVHDAGFWFSYAAVLFLIYVLGMQLAPLSKIKAAIKMQLAISLGLMPITLLLMGKASIISPLVNLIAVPFFSIIIVPLAVGGAMISLISTKVALVILMLAHELLRLSLSLMQAFSNVPFAMIEITTASLLGVFALLCTALIIIAPKDIPGKFIVCLWLLPLLFLRPAAPPEGSFWVTILDVGQGLAAIVTTKNHSLLYDAGPRRGNAFNAGEKIVAPVLQHYAIRNLDVMVISHNDNDHTGGVAAVLNKITAQKIYSSDYYDGASAQQKCINNIKWQWDGVEFEFLHPPAYFKGSKNNRSCVLKVSAGDNSVLLTGDIEKSAEKYLIKTVKDKLTSTVLLVPHHGSKTSSTKNFINAVAPEIALISAGYNNIYRHPHQQVVANYETAGIKLFNTAVDGAVCIAVDKVKAQPFGCFN